MLAKVHSYGINGLEAYPVTIEVDAGRGLPSTIIVGLPDNAVKESRERVRSAIKNSGYKFGPRRITINLSPADTKKEGPSFDLAIALGKERTFTLLVGGSLAFVAMLLAAAWAGVIPSLGYALSLSGLYMLGYLILYHRGLMESSLMLESLVEGNMILAGVLAFVWDPYNFIL